MKGLLRSNIRFHGRRYLATGLAVAIAVAFVVASLALGNAAGTAAKQLFAEQYQGAAVVVQANSVDGTMAGQEPLADTETLAKQVEALSEVGTVGVVSNVALDFSFNSNKINGRVSLMLPEPLRQPNYLEGAAPTAPDQIALDSRTAQILEAKVGDQITATDMVDSGSPYTLAVTGIYGSKANAAISLSFDNATMTADGLAGLNAELFSTGLLVASESGAVDSQTQTDVAAAVSAALDLGADSQLQVKTVDQIIEDGMSQINASVAQLNLIVLIFPVIAVIVAIIVITTTFQVIVQQRQRELALLRCLGASSKQVRRLIVGESMVVGTIASLIGVVAGSLLAAWGVSAVGLLPSFGSALESISLITAVSVFVLGIIITVISGARPAFRMAKTSPLAALNPVQNQAKKRGAGWWVRLVLGVILAAGAGSTMVWAALQGTDVDGGFIWAVLAGVVCLFGTILLLSTVFPYLTVLLASPFRGMLARMASGNAVRSPGRTSATGVSVVIGVTLIVMMLVGAGSLRTTLNTTLDAEMPADLIVTTASGVLTAEQVKQIEGVDGVSAMDVQSGFTSADGTKMVLPIGDQGVSVTDYSKFATVTRSDVAVPQGNQVFVNESSPFAEDETYSLCLDSTCEEVTIKFVSWIANPTEVGVGKELLGKLGGAPQAVQITAQLTDTSNFDVVSASISKLDSSFMVDGAAPARAMFDMIINVILLAVVAMLGVSVLVALVGVSNTLSLSVAERTRENGLLRALGMTKGQIARMLLLEAIFIAVAAALVGTGLGIFFGWIGILALPLGISNVIIAIPWGQVALVIAVATLAAAMASWLPGRRAARTSPVEALASE